MKKEAEKPKYSAKISGEKQSISEILARVFPPTMVPTKRTGWVFGIIFVIVVVIGLLQFPLSSLLAGQTDVAVEVGIPWIFLRFDLENPETLPVRFGSLILDLILYLIISYAIDIAINVVSRSFTPRRIAKSKHLTVYNIPIKSKTQQIAEKAAEKTHQVLKK